MSPVHEAATAVFFLTVMRVNARNVVELRGLGITNCWAHSVCIQNRGLERCFKGWAMEA